MQYQFIHKTNQFNKLVRLAPPPRMLLLSLLLGPRLPICRTSRLPHARTPRPPPPLPFTSIRRVTSSAPSSAAPLPAEGHPRVAIIGSGPSGLYVCARLLQRLPKCRIDVFDRAQAPFGLIYYGVAPDHVDMKRSMHGFERMFSENRARLSLFCNVDINRDISYGELCTSYEAVVLAYGASRARRMGVAGEGAPNSVSGKDFVSWYNGAPLLGPPPRLDQPQAVVIGNGNVAIDCSRILLTSSAKLAPTDITESALNALRKSKVRHVRVLGRRGPKEISFTIKELRELLGLDGVHAYCAIGEEHARQLRAELAGMERPRRRLMELLLAYAGEGRRARAEQILAEGGGSGQGRSLQLQFHTRPLAIETDPGQGGRVSAIRVQDTQTGREERIACGLLIYAIGFEHLLLDGVPRAENGQLKMVDWCHVPDEMAAVYATGWCSHAARGLIADSQQQAFSVADQIAEDWEQRRIPAKTKNSSEEIGQRLRSRNVHYISWDDWQHIDECERRMGAILGKAREKITDFTTMLRIMRPRNGST